MSKNGFLSMIGGAVVGLACTAIVGGAIYGGVQIAKNYYSPLERPTITTPSDNAGNQDNQGGQDQGGQEESSSSFKRESYDLAFGNKGTTCSDPGVWYYMVQDPDYTIYNAHYNAEDNTLVFYASSNDSTLLQLRIRPNLEIGTKYRVSFDVKDNETWYDTTVAAFIGRSDYDLNTYSSPDWVEDHYHFEYYGVVSDTEPFWFGTWDFCYETGFTIYNIAIDEIVDATSYSEDQSNVLSSAGNYDPNGFVID